jgi:TatD DNase family protein
MGIIDTHTHIYSKEFENNRKEVIEESLKANVHKLAMPCIDIDSIEPMLELSDQYPNICLPMIGIHPCHIDNSFETKLRQLENFISKNKFIAIGEIGLDFYKSQDYKKQQEKAFHLQIELAIDNNLPIVIHCRNAIQETLKILKHYKNVKGIFHCFSGSLEEANQIIELNFLLGIGGIVTFKNSNLTEIVANISMDNIVLETDSPYLAPTPYRGKINQPKYLIHIAEKLSQIKNLAIQEIANITSHNAMKVFNIN